MASGTIIKDFSLGYQLIVEWTSSSNINTNSSTVACKVKLYCPYRLGISERKNNRLIINGTTYYFDTPALSNYNAATHTLATINGGSIPHNADGSKNITITCYFDIEIAINDKYYGTLTATDTVALDTIPRQATLTAAPNFNDEGNPVISYSNLAGDSVSSLQACITDINGQTIYVPYRDISKTGSSYTFSLTTAERNTLRNATPNSNTMAVRFYVKTVIGENTYYSSLTKTLTIVNANPTLNPRVVDEGSVSTTLTGDPNKVIKGYNYMAVAANATAFKGATIKSYKITCGEHSTTNASGYFSGVESGTFVFTVSDSRGNTATKTITKTLINYIQLTCNQTIVPPTTDGVMEINIDGNYFNGSFGAVANTLVVQYRMKTNSGSYGSWTTATATLNGSKYTAKITISGLTYTNSYTIQSRAADKIYDGNSEPIKTTAEKKVKTLPVFDWGESDFNINAELKLEQLPVLKRHSSASAVVMSANGAIYLRPLGQGNDTEQLVINGHSGQTEISGYVYGRNNVLYSGGLFMSQEQTITLSQAVSKQPHGIVLVFCDYYGGELSRHWNSIFVDKYTIAAHDNAGHSFILSGINNTTPFSPMGMKYLYISDTVIRGSDANEHSSTANGITYDNYRFVLRYVIGV